MLSLRKYHHCIRTPTNFTNEQKWMSNSIVLLHVAECSYKIKKHIVSCMYPCTCYCVNLPVLSNHVIKVL